MPEPNRDRQEMKRLINRIKQVLAHSMFVKKATALMLGTGIAQVFSLLNLIVAAHLFSPGKIGVFQVVISYATIINTFSLLSYHFSLPGMSDKKAGAAVYGILVVLLAIIVGSFVFFSAMGYQEKLAVLLLILAYGLIALGEQVLVRDSSIYRIAIFRIARPLTVLVYLLLVVTKFRSIGFLINGFVGITLFFALLLFVFAAKSYFKRRFSLTAAWSVLKEKKKNAFFLTPSELLNALCYNLPTILIAHYFGHYYAGQYGVVIKLCFAPLLILGSSVGQVFHGDVANSLRNKRGEPYRRFIALSRYSLFLGCIIFFGLIFVFPAVLDLMLGKDWQVAGHISQILSPLFGFMTFVSPMTVLFYLFDEQAFFFLSQSFYLFVTALAFGVGIIFHNLYLGIALYSALGILRYVIVWLKINRVALRLKEVG